MAGNSEVPARSLHGHIQKLMAVEPGENVTGMELEFKVTIIWFLIVNVQTNTTIAQENLILIPSFRVSFYCVIGASFYDVYIRKFLYTSEMLRANYIHVSRGKCSTLIIDVHR